MQISAFFRDPWEIVGVGGQCIFGARFIYQWLVSEKAKKSIMPVGFWWLSIVGSILIFIYALHKQSITFTIPVLTGVPVYVRNLMLIQRESKNLGV
ncbi:lipid-A-disaccharide synthase N-terminal domain-containing protein [Candidatus Sumerlaeota bacterium]|nr:lipid-A-disaccharide synthase N-terminal domain-containing protein [Candidatus Sumerlaeota bacterium]